jgi:hypothetical protein
MERAAVISPCGLYRYQLSRIWDDSLPRCLFAGLNPSKADGSQDDPTVRRMIGFARDWGYGGLFVVNLFAFRATDPKDMKTAIDPIGPENDDYIRRLTLYCDITIAAWGCHGDHLGRANQVIPWLRNLHHLGLTKSGHPRHPLYLPKDTKPIRWEVA